MLVLIIAGSSSTTEGLPRRSECVTRLALGFKPSYNPIREEINFLWLFVILVYGNTFWLACKIEEATWITKLNNTHTQINSQIWLRSKYDELFCMPNQNSSSWRWHLQTGSGSGRLGKPHYQKWAAHLLEVRKQTFYYKLRLSPCQLSSIVSRWGHLQVGY